MRCPDCGSANVHVSVRTAALILREGYHSPSSRQNVIRQPVTCCCNNCGRWWQDTEETKIAPASR